MTHPNTSAADWLDAVEALAKRARQPGESFEQAFARVTAKGPGAAFLALHRDPRGRLPEPVHITRKGDAAEAAEARLHRMAVSKARDSGESYEMAMSRLLATPEGLELWQAARDEDPRRCAD